MVDLLLPAGQWVCVIGLTYGFMLVMMHAECVDTIDPRCDLVARSSGFEIKLVHDDSVRLSGVAADTDFRGRRSRIATHVD
ncbi:MAG: hypothetical protein V4637_11460 [Pseudomonadota bacterium]